MEDNKNKSAVRVFSIDNTYKAPEMKINHNRGIVEWGKKNDYPEYVLDLYNSKGSSYHTSVINKKTKLISGKGFEEVLSPELKEFIKKNKLNEEVKKATLDYELFNAFSFEIIWNREGSAIASLKHLPIHKLRLGVKSDDINFNHYWFSNDWKNYRKDLYKPEVIREFNPLLKKGKQVYVYVTYNPQTDGQYPILSYSNTIGSIETHYEIRKFHLNQIKKGFAGGFLINFATGIPTVEEQDELFDEFINQYTGTDGEPIIVTYSEGKEDAPELNKIELNASDEKFAMLLEQIENDIVIGSEIPAPLVIQTAGKLASTSERKELMQEFQQAYVTPRQEIMQDVINNILSLNEYNEDVVLRKYIDEPAPVNKVAVALGGLSPLVATKILDTMTKEEIRGLIGLEGGNIETDDTDNDNIITQE
ncbi:MAG: Unknown protein [uncultured Sulfurovum sp.]|uniref:Phage portal protein n=1 Tax=uncultured Sulfurovum sp. TaxID=269237 RepID=A0A6S6SK33_9BACT|nr:MAG: Unknown protein [uncultured Sulfurovum sp.]